MPAETSHRSEVTRAIRASLPGLVSVGAFSMIINLMMLTGPLFMILVYDRALPSGSVPTLIGLSALMIGLYAVFGLLSQVRSRLLMRIGNRIGNRLQERVFSAQLAQVSGQGGAKGQDSMRDLNTIREFMGGQTPAVLFDVPWTPIYLLCAYVLHPYLGYAGLAGVIFLVFVAILNNALSQRGVKRASQDQTRAARLMSDVTRNHEVISAMNMGGDLYSRWSALQNKVLVGQNRTSDLVSDLSVLSRTVRMLLQSAVLGLGAYLAIGGDLSAGSIIAASVLVGRALAPAEQAISGWRQCVAATSARARLETLLADNPVIASSIQLPHPKGDIELKGVYAAAPGGTVPILKNVSLSLKAGEVLAVIGASGSGKSTLARVIVGAWTAIRGHVRIDRADIAYWNAIQLRDAIGYLPQSVELFDGTVRENIARFQADAEDQDIIAAAKGANVHDLILNLPNAYDTLLGEGGSALSGGERQRIGLARVLYKSPSVVVLDEPNANLDAAGMTALHMTIERLKSAGKTVILIAHRQGALALADKVLVLDKGQVSAFGPREDVLNTYSQNRARKAKTVSKEELKDA
ncbi:type I secretion system permease/ATPase [Ruegeria sp. HKCCD8929]|uniref:type I secretion system permease/ATPase n=1 Tax=Ruegeria sp. HKCCD8929 TaxID=2683006 RepID=UPI001487F946|nr:type I secretion system permease/ATPase [Ruegeria sp. HKCCD8929]